MRLSQIYCNLPEAFGPIRFNPGVNVVLGEIRLPENRDKDTHNLGKTTLALLLNYCLLRKRSKEFFLFKQEHLFSGFIFFLEIETLTGGFLTIRRSVQNNTRIAFKRHAEPLKNLVNLADTDWDHADIPFERAKQILDGILDLRAVKPWDYRRPVGYALRTQRDFNDVFQLDKFRRSHADWKPYIAQLLGLNASLVQTNFDLTRQIDELENAITVLRGELAGLDGGLDAVEGLLTLKVEEADRLATLIEDFDFHLADSQVNKELVDNLDQAIAAANQERYYLSTNRDKITHSLEQHTILFDPKSATQLFEEAGQVFPEQLHKTYDDLIRFNRAISDERRGYLAEELKALEIESQALEARLSDLNQRRKQALAFLRDTDSMHKYRRLNQTLVGIRTEIERLTSQRDAYLRLRDKDRKRIHLQAQRDQIRQQLEDDIEAQARTVGRYQTIRKYVNEITREVLDRHALISTRLNQQGNIEFAAEYLGADGRPSSEDQGKSYRQLLCAAFDLAVARALLNAPYIRFLYHDGLLEGLDNRKKLNLIDTIRRYAGYGIQQIVTIIDSDLPVGDNGECLGFRPGEVILTLHDEGQRGRLFRMEEW
jgi:uncharacterized protein YydD (DUF2326 family)